MKPRRTARVLAAAAAAGILSAAAPAIAQQITGLPYVADGDTLGFGETRVRLWGIDAPEAGQTCAMLGQTAPIGTWATQTLRRLIGRDAVTCYILAREGRDHVLGRCRTASVENLAHAMVAAGFAWDYKRQSSGIYADVEAEARRQRLGVWAGDEDCMAPWDWRRR